MKKITKFLIHISIFSVLMVPVLSFAVNYPLVDCQNDCGFIELMAMVNKIIRFILFDLALPIAAIMFAYAGILMVTSGGSTESRATAKKIFINTAIGLVIAAAAWLIVMETLRILGYDGQWIGFVKPGA